MTEINQKIIDMIMNNASVNEISSSTGLSPKQLFHRLNMLKIKGYNFSKKYYYTGDIAYKLQKSLETENEISILTSPNDQEFEAVLISDLHLSNKKERIDLLNYIYEFCIKNDIHIIINGGDLVDGLLGNIKSKKFKSPEEQITYALKKHPYDKSILNFIVLGNHDYDILKQTGQNLETILNMKRHDIISLGYGYGKLNIKNDSIIVKHPKTPTSRQPEALSCGLVISGHTHTSKSQNYGNLYEIFLPSLSSINMRGKKIPGFIKAKISFNNGMFSLGTFEQYLFIGKLYKVNELCYELSRGKNNSIRPIKYEEERKSIFLESENETKTLEKKKAKSI